MHTEVQVGNDVLVDPVSKVFAPLGASNEPVLAHLSQEHSQAKYDQTYLLSVPTCNHNGPERLPAQTEQSAKATNDFMG